MGASGTFLKSNRGHVKEFRKDKLLLNISLFRILISLLFDNFSPFFFPD